MRVFLLMVSAVVSAYLATSCLFWGVRSYDQGNNFLSSSRDLRQPDGIARLAFIDVATHRKNRLEASFDNQKKVLEYMPWAGERDKVLQKQLLTLQELLKFSPASSSDWLRLLAVQNELMLPVAQLKFSLIKAIQGVDWHRKSSPVLIHYCVALDSIISTDLRALCDGVILNYPWRENLQHQAKGMSVNANQLALRLTALREASENNE